MTDHSPTTAGELSIEALREEAARVADVLSREPQLPASTDLGSYPLIYFGSDSDEDFIYPICPACATSVEFGSDSDQLQLAGAEVYWEGPLMDCEAAFVCDGFAVIRSAYGDPDANDPLQD